MWSILCLGYSCCNDANIISMLLSRRARLVRRSTRWIYTATRLPSRSCSSTGIHTPQYLWSSLCHPLMTSVQCQLHPAPPPAYRGSLSQRPCTPPPTAPARTAARTLCAQTTRWCCQSMMKCWRHHPPLLMCRWVRTGTLRILMLIKFP